MTPLSGSQIYKPNEVHLPPIRFAIHKFTLWQLDRVASGSQLTNRMTPPIQSIQLTIYEPDVRLSGSQISKNENRMASSGCPTRNFKIA